MKGNYVENYGVADARQQSWEKDHGYRKQKPLTSKERAKKQLEAELYSLQHEYPDLERKAYHNKLFRFAWVEEMDKIFDNLEITVDEILTNNIDT